MWVKPFSLLALLTLYIVQADVCITLSIATTRPRPHPQPHRCMKLPGVLTMIVRPLDKDAFRRATPLDLSSLALSKHDIVPGHVVVVWLHLGLYACQDKFIEQELAVSSDKHNKSTRNIFRNGRDVQSLNTLRSLHLRFGSASLGSANRLPSRAHSTSSRS